MGTVPANFHGKKGRSGRKSMSVEKAKSDAIKKAWNKVEQAVDEKDVKEVALPIALKDMVNKVGNPDGSNIVIPIYGGSSIQKHPSNPKDIQLDKEDTSDSGGDIGE
jgi:NADH:ubiquinone oxidoreductase subunit F (NADH-binding)